MSRGVGWLALWLGSSLLVQACEEPRYAPDSGPAATSKTDAGGARPGDDGADDDSAGPGAPDEHDPPWGVGRDGEPAVVVDRPDATRGGGPEAGTTEASSSPDAGPGAVSTTEPVVGGLPDWALPLVGTYAARSVTFSYDDLPVTPINTRNVQHSLLRVVRRGEELLLTRQMCSYVVSIRGEQGSPPLIFKNAASTPPMQGRIVLGANQTFSTAPILQHLGFDPTRNTCPMGSTRRARYADQTWLTGDTCSCHPSLTPEHVDDCRVIDDDADGKPGITARGPSPLGTTEADYAMVFDYSVTILDGKVRADRAHTLREVWAQSPACINAASDRCNIGHNELCPGSFTALIPVGDEVTCASLNMGDFGPADPYPVEVDCRAKQGR